MDPPNGLNGGRNDAGAQPEPVSGATPPSFTILSTANSQPGMPAFPEYSATTAAALARVKAAQAGTPGYEAARAELMKSLTTSDKLPIPAPMTASKRGKGGRRKSGENGSTPGSTAPPENVRGRGRVGRPRGRGRGGARGGKRKRSESADGEDDEDNSDVGNESYTPLPKTTKSGRSVNKPTQYVPIIPEPATHSNKKKRPQRRNIEAAVCKLCHRPTSPANNQIVFCDGCGTPYHQYCHDPPIENEVVEVQEKEWFCLECVKSREAAHIGSNAEGFVSGENLSTEEKRKSLESLPISKLIELVIRASSIQPSLALFPASTLATAAPPKHNTATSKIASVSASADSTAAATASDEASSGVLPASAASAGLNPDPPADIPPAEVEPYDGYDTDPPAHYPKPGNGLARTLPPEAQDLDWLVDEDEDVFSHSVGIGVGLGFGGVGVGMGMVGLGFGGVGMENGTGAGS